MFIMMTFGYSETCYSFQTDSYKQKKNIFSTSTFWSVGIVYIRSKKSCSLFRDLHFTLWISFLYTVSHFVRKWTLCHAGVWT